MTDVAAPPEPDPEALPLAILTVFQVKQGELLSVMVQLGHRLGLFETLADGRARSVAELAEATGTQERWVQEWSYAVAGGGLVRHERDDDGVERFSCSPEMAAVLGRPEHPSFAAASFGAPAPSNVDRLAEAFRTGVGFGWGDHGDATTHMQASMSAGRHTHFLVSVFLDAIPGMTERLTEGCRVVDIGCGAGIATEAVARAFPASTVVGIDPSASAIEAASERLAEEGLGNLSFRTGTFDDLEPGGADLLLTLDVLHDLPRPAEAVRAARRAVADDGVWYVADIKASPTFEENRRIPMVGLFYAMSVAYCMNSALSEPDGAGLGTLGLHPERLRGMVESAGFTGFEPREFDQDVSNRYYEIRP